MGSLTVRRRRDLRSKILEDRRNRFFRDEDDFEEEDTLEKEVEAKESKKEEAKAEDVLKNLTKEDVEALMELIPYKEALIKIAKGEFEIEKVVENTADEEEDDVIDKNLEQEVDEMPDFGNEEEEEEVITDSDEKINEAWRKRFNQK